MPINIQQNMTHNKKNSDFTGLKTITSLKNENESSQYLPQFGSYNQTFSHYSSIAREQSNKNKSNKLDLQQLRKIDVDSVVMDAYSLMKYFYEKDTTGYLESGKKWFKNDWKKYKKLILEHFNKLTYLQKNTEKSYAQIQELIMQQWENSPLLDQIRKIWYETTLQIHFKTTQHFKSHYQTFKEFIGQVSYLVFQGFFKVMEKKMKSSILDRLTERTANFIITSTPTWHQLFTKVIIPLFRLQYHTLEKSFRIFRNFDLSTLQIKDFIVNTSQFMNQMPKTTQKLKEFMETDQLYHKIKFLIQMRESLQTEIINNQERMINRGVIKKYKLLDKDDFISCLIYIVIKAEIDCEELLLHTKYFRFLFGDEQATATLSQFGCDSYLTDLAVASSYLHQLAVNQQQTWNFQITDPDSQSLIIYKTSAKINQSNREASKASRTSLTKSLDKNQKNVECNSPQIDQENNFKSNPSNEEEYPLKPRIKTQESTCKSTQ